ncbi:MAG TPA: hypothetical protein VG013_30875 [Gemmataceae bacterium]|jgi:thymidylate kinase|nr:hypothetical protein [Gemmataceae bacterium]
MKIVVAIEGVDGSGKSSLARAVYRLCQEHGRPCTAVGRRGANASPLVVKLTRVLSEEGGNLTRAGDILIRLAREYQRADRAATTPDGVVVLDRFVLTVLALVRENGQDMSALLPFFNDIIARAGLHATIFAHCPFEVAYARVTGRRPDSRTRRPGHEERLRKLADFMAKDFGRGLLTGQQWPIDNSHDLAGAEQQLAAYLLPYLRDP